MRIATLGLGALTLAAVACDPQGLEDESRLDVQMLDVASQAFGGPFPGWAACDVNEPCEAGVGDCDADEECVAGTICVQNVGAYFGWDESVDVCIESTYPGNDRCSAANPCPAGLGDCDTNSDCLEGSVCALNIGAAFEWPANADVCVVAASPSNPPSNPPSSLQWVLETAESCLDMCGSPTCSCLQPKCASNASVGSPCSSAGQVCWSDLGTTSRRLVCQ